VVLANFNPLKPIGKYMYQPHYQSVTIHIVINVFRTILTTNFDYFLEQR
jgi:hypothetical protein